MFILKNHIHVYDECVCDGQKKGWEEGKRLWTVVTPLEWNQKGRASILDTCNIV